MHTFQRLLQPIGQFIVTVWTTIREWSHEFDRVTIENNSDWEHYNETITLDLYLPQPDRNDRLTILNPVLGGDNKVAQFMANYFALFHRRNCVIVHRGQYPFNATTPEGFEERLQAYLYNYQVMENHLEDIGFYDPDDTETISIGTSMGGIVNSILATEDHYDRYISLVAGASIIETMYNSSMSKFDEWFQQQAKKYAVDRSDIRDRYFKAIQTDFVHRYEKMDPDKFFTICALFDSVVPTQNQKKLVDLGEPHTNVWLPCGHYTLILFTPVFMPILSWWTFWTSKD